MASLPPKSGAQQFYGNLVATNIKVEGLTELGQTLKTLEAKVAKALVRKGLRAGAKEILREVQSLAPKKTGKMAAGFSVTGGGRLKKGEIGVRVQVGKKWFVGDLFYAGFINFGWRLGKRPPRAKKTWYQRFSGRKATQPTDTRREIPGVHFVERATQKKAPAALRVFVETIRAGLDKAVKDSKKGS